MKKLIILLIIIFLGSRIGISQNLVPNPSFENITSCPTSHTQLNKATPWVPPTSGTPDLYNSCDISQVVGVPISNIGLFGRGDQPARTGVGYAGFVTFWDYIEPCGAISVDYREYLQAPLVSPLLAGITYEVSMYVSLRNSSSVIMASNGIGAYFSNAAVNTSCSAINIGPLPYTPQVVESTIITDTVNWIPIYGTFVAVGGEQYITIGNFQGGPTCPCAGSTGTIPPCI